MAVSNRATSFASNCRMLCCLGTSTSTVTQSKKATKATRQNNLFETVWWEEADWEEEIFTYVTEELMEC
ncbi:hypothetical protein [Spirosoma radiotolerans]|uniref:hypothetical protein n=1 Tax=Spirosoma radiotolerans TaxID=1379870 RepID=UPI0015CFC13D|nr:hypothetical protein [Spirosoma radiotolerans]